MKIRNYILVVFSLILLLIPQSIFSQDLRFPSSPKEQLLNNNRQRHADMTGSRSPASWDAFGIYKPTELVGDVEMAWVNTYASGLAAGAVRANAVAVDNSGNVYVAGGSGRLMRVLHGDPFVRESALIIKYDAAGVEQWIVDYNGGGNRSAEIIAIVVDDLGSVYVTGNEALFSCLRGGCFNENVSMLTIKYNADGVEQWVVEYDGGVAGEAVATAIALDDSGNVYVIGESWSSETNGDYVTIKYSADGIEEWVTRYDGPSSEWDFPKAIALDDSGNVYVTGSSEDSTTGDDYATVKYSSDGIEQWVARYNGPGTANDHATAIAIDDLGNVYVTGESRFPDTHEDYITVKYSSDGVEQWVARYNGPVDRNDVANAIAVDDFGNVYVTGESEGSGTFIDYATVKYDSDGVEQWVARYHGSGNGDDRAKAIAIDDSGNVYVTGESWSRGDVDYITVKYSSDGVEQWAVRYVGGEFTRGNIAALTLDSFGNVFIAGYSQDPFALRSDLIAVKYSPEGIEQWLLRYGVKISRDRTTAITHDGSGNVYVTGSSGDSTTGDDYATIKYNTDGIEQWVARYNGPVDGNDVANAIAVDELGNVYVTGSSGHTSDVDYTDFATIKYNADGVEQWVSRYDGPERGFDIASSIAIDDLGNVYVTGNSWGGGGWHQGRLCHYQIQHRWCRTMGCKVERRCIR